MRAAGIGEFANLGLCTYANEEHFFSYRRTTHRGEPDYGRLISAITLVPRFSKEPTDLDGNIMIGARKMTFFSTVLATNVQVDR